MANRSSLIHHNRDYVKANDQTLSLGIIMIIMANRYPNIAMSDFDDLHFFGKQIYHTPLNPTPGSGQIF